ncbi:MAG: undecaprenyl-diphosphate phosphatase [Clostridia bacterium]|nr:undecaprenyl-diphosphate phosphatase [Clostridia bacterium]
MIFDIIRSIFLGIVEGITEWLPISSTGHLILFNEFLHNEGMFTASDLYIYVIQLGAILAVVTVFFRKLNPFSPKKTAEEKRGTWQMWAKVIVGCIPAAVIGLALDNLMDRIETWQVVSAMLIVYGIAFIIVEKINKKATVTSIDDMSYKTALTIGAFQVLSIVPGTSRSGSTILGGMIAGCSREVAAEFSFFLAIPVMFGVSFLKIVKNLDMLNAGNIVILLIGMAVSYLVSLVAVRFLMSFVKKHTFTVFGIYRIALGIIVILCLGVLGL